MATIKAHIEPWLSVPGHPGQTWHPPVGAPPDPGMGAITFVSYNFEGQDYDTFTFTCLLGDGAPEIIDGFGGWEVLDRARNVGTVIWNGRKPLTIKIPIMFDNWSQGKSIESDIRQLEKMAGLDDNMRQPPLVLINSMGVVPHDAHDASQNDWVISEIEWGDSDRNEFGNRVRQAAGVTLIEFNYDSVIGGIGQRPSSQSKKKAKKIGQRRTYVVQHPGETLITIAHKTLGNSHKWRELRDANKKNGRPLYKNPYYLIPMGTVLVIPRKK